MGENDEELPAASISVDIILSAAPRSPRVVIIGLGALLLACFALLWFVPLAVPFIAFASIFSLVWSSSRRARLGYHRGYFAGRKMMWESLGEAQIRGLNMDEWLQAESERDAMYYMHNLASRRQKRMIKEAVIRATKAIQNPEDSG